MKFSPSSRRVDCTGACPASPAAPSNANTPGVRVAGGLCALTTQRADAAPSTTTQAAAPGADLWNMWCEYELRTTDQTWRWRIALDEPPLPVLRAEHPGLPVWTELGTARCPGCPLERDDREPCPAAIAVADVVDALSAVASVDAVDVTVTLPEREVRKRTTGASAARSLLGLLMATSGCPVLEVMRPLARHHLPFASEEEWLFRMVGLHLLRGYFATQDGKVVSGLHELPTYLAQLRALNGAFARRLRQACAKDAGPNAICQLFSLSVGATADIDDGLGSLRAFVGA